MTPLHLATLGGHVEVIRTLLDCPDINVVMFVRRVEAELLHRSRFFLQHAKNKDGKTALEFCQQNPNRDWQLCTELIKKFLQKPVRSSLSLSIRRRRV
jgi:Ankyrin repeat